VVMEETLAQALAALFKAPPAAIAPVTAESTPNPASASPAVPMSGAARAALDHYERAIAKLKAGDWAGFGKELDALRPLLDELNKQPKPAAPASAKPGP